MIGIDIEMPDVCDHCRFFDDNGDYPTCIVTQHSKGYAFRFREKRMDDCPLQYLTGEPTEETFMCVIYTPLGKIMHAFHTREEAEKYCVSQSAAKCYIYSLGAPDNLSDKENVLVNLLTRSCQNRNLKDEIWMP